MIRSISCRSRQHIDRIVLPVTYCPVTTSSVYSIKSNIRNAAPTLGSLTASEHWGRSAIGNPLQLKIARTVMNLGMRPHPNPSCSGFIRSDRSDIAVTFYLERSQAECIGSREENASKQELRTFTQAVVASRRSFVTSVTNLNYICNQFNFRPRSDAKAHAIRE
jgi:hypothetical protein